MVSIESALNTVALDHLNDGLKHKKTSNPNSDNDKDNTPEITIDQFLVVMQPVQRMLGFKYLDFKRIDNRFAFPQIKMMYFGMFIVLIDMLGNIVKIYLEIRANRLSEAQQVGAVFSIETLCFVRGFSLMTKYKDMAKIANDIDDIFPREKYLQRCMHLPELAKFLEMRFRFLYTYSSVSLVAFCGIPCYKYIRYHDRSIPVPDEYHQHASWLPFGIKQSHRCYPFIYIYESYMSVGAVSFLFTWDLYYTIVMSQICMHFGMVCRELLKMDARDTNDSVRSKIFFNRLKECIVYVQHLNRLGSEFNAVFDLSILGSDMVSAASVCFHMYLIANTDDIMSIVLFTFPCAVQVWLTYDISKQGSELETVTGNIKEMLYNQNWFEGSIEYRKHILMWMQHANEPFRLTAWKMFEVNMAHFKQMMVLAYQMFTFLQSRQARL